MLNPFKSRTRKIMAWLREKVRLAQQRAARARARRINRG